MAPPPGGEWQEDQMDGFISISMGLWIRPFGIPVLHALREGDGLDDGTGLPITNFY